MKTNICLKCKLCGYNFSHKYNLKRHLTDNLCKEFKKLNLYEIYLKFNDNDTYIKTKSVNIQTDIKIKNKCKSRSTQTKFDDIFTNNELYPIEKVKYDYIKFKNINECIEKYNYDTKIMYISKILEVIFCNIQYTQNHVIKYTKTYPPTFVFLSNKNKNELYENNESNESKYLTISSTDLLVEYFYPHIRKILPEIYKNFVNDCKINHDWDEWYDFNEDKIKQFNEDLKNEKALKDAIKYFLKNIVVNHRILKYNIKN